MSRWCTVAPLELSSLHGAVFPWPRFELAGSLSIQGTPKWLTAVVPWPIDLDEADFCLLLEYEAPEALGEAQRRAVDIIAKANLALWLTRPCALFYCHLVHAEFAEGAWRLRDYLRKGKRPGEEEFGAELLPEDLQTAQRLHQSLVDVPHGEAIEAAASVLWGALGEEEWIARYVMLWIAMEALFAPDDHQGELIHRLSNRLAFFLSSGDPNAARTNARRARELYKLRSKVVHGLRIRKDALSEDESHRARRDTETYLRLALKKILLDSNNVAIFSSRTKRDIYLDDLPFGQQDATSSER